MAEALARTADPRPADPAPLGRGTLGRRLVISVTALVAVMAILLSALTALATRQLLVRQIDEQLSGVASRSQQLDPRGQRGPQAQLLQRGLPVGSVSAAFGDDGSTQDGRILPQDQDVLPSRLPEAVLDQLSELPVSRTPESFSLVGLGHYRVRVYAATISYRDGTSTSGRVVVGVPLAGVDRTLVQLIGLEAVLTLLAMAGAAAVARALVIRSLRPLNRVAATAQQVSQLPLDRGEVALAVRVPPEDADPTSEVGRVGQALNHMLNNVEDALAARQASETKVRRFVADASHELRNPLAAIRGYAELTRRSHEQIPPDATFAISRVESEAGRMSRLVEDLLLLARLDSGPDLDVRPSDLTEIVINAVSDARAAGPEHVWQLALPDQPVLALGDPHRLHQVVANLLANARTHTPAGTRVQAAIAVRDGQAVITVADSGPGIPPEIQDQVFERFTRADTSRVRAAGAAQGASTGLGLAIVAAVVEAHHGQVRVQSEPGWTEFTVLLPLARELGARPAPPPAPTPTPAPTPADGYEGYVGYDRYEGRGPDMRPPQV